MFAVGIPIDAIADYDLQKYRLALKKDFNINNIINEATQSDALNFDALRPIDAFAKNCAQNSLLMQ